ncbi:DUF4381 domain-containing protein [Echinimonas agarilytica]|uniref:DUF4381 domain-containing protein n=1 Tax=Echinimonas agarilytica TaxID=1215918 RepID=A0AA42B6X0_9GAMM|nr:DUF4381 domain-containing protein [Echinimonas agarilytica]MCM2679222.1 DUF4381 domain-containing protein [Echinimonas agarilytica]
MSFYNLFLTVATQQQLPIADIHLPRLSGWFPLAPGWWAVLAVLVSCIAVVVTRYIKQKKHREYAQQASQEIRSWPRSKVNPESINEVLKVVALRYSQAPHVASLSGQAWQQWLSAHTDTQAKAHVLPMIEQLKSYQYSGKSMTPEHAEALQKGASSWVAQSWKITKKEAKS